jgi:putative N-acetylmannosamine-6-phosphate epimerase
MEANEEKLISKFVKAIVDREHQMMAEGQILSPTQRIAKIEIEFDSIAEEIEKL